MSILRCEACACRVDTDSVSECPKGIAACEIFQDVAIASMALEESGHITLADLRRDIDETPNYPCDSEQAP